MTQCRWGWWTSVWPPGMEDGEEADLGAEVAGVGGDRAQRLGDGPEEEAVDDGLVVGGDLGDRRGHGEDGGAPRDTLRARRSTLSAAGHVGEDRRPSPPPAPECETASRAARHNRAMRKAPCTCTKSQ